jgi:hypothetical protein
MTAEIEQDQLGKEARPHLFMESALATRLLHDSTVIASPVLIEIVNNLTFAEFYEIYAHAKPNTVVALDNSELVEFLLAGNDDGKKLVVASFSGGGAYREGIKAETAIKLASLSRAHKIALLSNVRVDWYGISYRDASVGRELIAATILSGEHEEKRALLRNPRMDRRFVADVIKGKDEFHAIPAPQRFFYGVEAIKAKEIESKDYPEKDSPDDNEMYFDKPERALLVTMREVLADTDIKGLVFELPNITRLYYHKGWLSIDDEDWLSDDQKREAERISDWHARYKSRNRMALLNFINWVSSWSIHEPQVVEIKEGDNEFDLDERYAKGNLAVMLSFKAFCGLGNEEIKKGMAVKNWCVRAGALAAGYAKLGTKEQTQFLTRYRKDPYALVRGLALVQNFWKRCETDGLESLLRKHRIKISEATRHYLHYPGHEDDAGFARTGREHLTTSTKSAGAFGYGWRVLVNVFYVAVVLYVFDKLQGRSEAIVTVAVLGLIYVTIRSIAIGQVIALANSLKVIEADLIRVRELVRDEYARDRLEASKADSEVFSRERNKLFIDGFFLSIVSIICLFALFSQLGR